MSEITTTAPGGSFPTFGLEVISQGPVTLRKPPVAPNNMLEVIGSQAPDTIRPIGSELQWGLKVRAGDGNDVVEGSSQKDEIFAGRGDDQVSGGGGGDSLYGRRGADQLFGEAGNDLIYGGLDDDTIYGGSGDDDLFGGSGDDVLYGEDGDDLIYGRTGNDEIDGGAGDDFLFGGMGDDIIVGGDGDDVMKGGAGDDELFAGAGTDLLFGGSGKDRFYFGAGSNAQVDEIADFNVKDDTIVLSQALLPASGLTLGKLQAKDFKAVDRMSDGVSAKIVYEKSTGLVYYNPKAGVDVRLLKLDTNLPLTASDFVIDP